MVTKAYIVELPKYGDNHFKVRVPIVEDNTGTPAIFPALLCVQPGDFGGYEVDDCVFITFEGDKHMDTDAIGETAVIIGKLYQDNFEPSRNTKKIDSIYVDNQARLPVDTKIGNYSINDIFSATQQAGTNLDYINKLSSINLITNNLIGNGGFQVTCEGKELGPDQNLIVPQLSTISIMLGIKDSGKLNKLMFNNTVIEESSNIITYDYDLKYPTKIIGKSTDEVMSIEIIDLLNFFNG